MREQLTESDVKKIREEIEYRKLVVRKEAIEAVKEARAHGDLSENFEYHAAKKDKNRNESRIRYLERMLKTAVIVSDQSEDGVAGINNRITVYFPEDDEEETFKLVTSIRGNSLNGYISTESPIGKAIMKVSPFFHKSKYCKNGKPGKQITTWRIQNGMLRVRFSPVKYRKYNRQYPRTYRKR